MGSSWKLVLVFSVIFLTGALCGWLVTSSMGPKRPTPNPTRNFHTWSEDLAERIEKNGALTDSERELVRPRLEEAVRKMQAIRMQSLIDISDAFDSAIVDIESTLPPEQKKRLEHFREGRKRWLQKQIEKQKEQGR
jgi:hypothetical protein